MQPFNHIPDNTLENNFFQAISPRTVQLLLGATIGTFLFTGYLQFTFYNEVFQAITGSATLALAAVIALITQVVRFGILIAGANDFAKGRTGRGAFSLFCSICVTIFCAYEASELAHIWTQTLPQYGNAIHLIVQFMVWAGYALEIRLIVSVAKDNTTPPHQNQQPNRTNRQHPDKVYDLSPLSNGNSVNH